jgi:hypothetical protein
VIENKKNKQEKLKGLLKEMNIGYGGFCCLKILSRVSQLSKNV